MPTMIDAGVSIVIPAYNEGANIRRVVEDVYAFLRANFPDFEIIVVDDGSRDDTVACLESLVSTIPLKIVRNPGNKGKGYSVKSGVMRAEKDFVLFCDADLSTPLKELIGFFDHFAAGYDIVIGSRAMPDSRLAVKQGFLRRSMGKTFNFFLRVLLFGGIRDTQCGFKCFKRGQARRLFALQTIDRFCFDAEVLFIARRLGLKIKEAGVEWRNRSDSRVAIIKDSFNMFADLFRIRINAWRDVYDSVKAEGGAGVLAGPGVRGDAGKVPAAGPQKTLL